MTQEGSNPPPKNQSLMQYARAWGENSFPPTLLATLIAAQHMRPFQPLPMIFPPALLFTTYLNLLDYKVDAAGVSAAWSGLYLLLAAKRKQPFMKKWNARGIVRGAAMGLGFTNMVSGGLVYMLGKRRDEDGEGLSV
ncbi:hypothetical protein RJZ56_002287 [Blastomyces dermatitidis]|uniref:Altered inheritance of mitochondria protein 19 n=3 Tax=Blastomyces TaxID=229219 RepID=A0A179UEE4_BLAGS|nr:uncharacterized protein BDBG_02609 [Blastomyces gilchristii SLH14081]XP_045275066.1 uncharacterized protein BDCG_02933 [Blastomyces dermatitidis ER-3]EGE79215.1 hypothetical protein BDDG_02153 [Blastomyces dermatitidis ATCC 18188]EQL32224.1 hypothetical protein BDFG_05583 [Blastomyces dermatitidis ATCC 26199]EEQ87813.1 hypothetical protein BDCG_02933 [Blastomyces dermatitidis ER-3]OAT06396.1 hypothetical protein BDBG_02609 [Blastomyces gilchristii SLH14081]